MSNLILPDNLIQDLNAEREEMIQLENTPMVRKLNRELKQLDQFLEIVYVGPKAPRAYGIEPGRWHVRRSQPGIVDSYWPIMGPNGEYMDLSMQLSENMKKADLWREGALQELRDRQVREAEQRERQSELEREQMRDQMAEDIRAGRRVFGDGGLKKKVQFQG